MFLQVENLRFLVCHHWDWVHLGGVESLVGAEEAGDLLPHHLLDAVHHDALAEGDGDGADGVHEGAEHGPDVGELEADRGVVFSWLKAPTSAFILKTLLRHYAKRALTPRSLNMTLGLRRNYLKGWAAIRHYANQTARPL